MSVLSSAVNSAFESFGNALINVGDWFLSLGYNVWNGAGKIAIDYAQKDPMSSSNAWATVTGNIFSTMLAVGSALSVLYFVLGWLNESIDIRTNFTLEAMFRFFVRYIIAAALIVNSLTFAEGITRCATALVGTLSADVTIEEPVGFFDNLGESTSSRPTNSSEEDESSGGFLSNIYRYASSIYDSFFGSEEEETSDEEGRTGGGNYVTDTGTSSSDDTDGGMWIAYGLVALIGGIVGGAVIIVCAIQLVVTVMQRLFKMLLCIPFAPVALAGFAGGREFSRSGEAWIRTYVSYCLEAVVIVLAISISFSMFKDVSIFDEVGGVVGVVLQIVEYCLPMIVTCACVKGADSVVRRCMGL